MSKARTLADFISDGSEFADGTISVAEVSGAAPLASPTFTGTVTVPGITSTNNISLGDTNKLMVGSGNDLQLLHNGANSYLDNFTGNLYISNYSDDRVIQLTGDDGTGAVTAYVLVNGADGTVSLNHYGSNKLITAADGVDITGDVGATTATITGKTTTDELDLNALAATISDTAVDIFVYDTRKDSDGGAWRKRTQHTSWYNETLNTSTRGSRKEFPAVAVIVAENNQVTIYDGDDPDMPMWMVFNSVSAPPKNMINTNPSNGNLTSISAINGVISVGGGGGNVVGVSVVNFISDSGVLYWVGQIYTYGSSSPISQRNGGSDFINPTSVGLVNALVNDVAMTVLPNAPIDAATGLPVPTIAVATNGGVSVIKDDGTVVSGHTGVAAEHIMLHESGALVYGVTGAGNDNFSLHLDSGNTTRDTFYDNRTAEGVYDTYLNEGSGECLFKGDKFDLALAQTKGLLQITEEPDFSTGLHNRITSDYNTGWMNGDIKLATLSDTDDTDVTGSELVTNGTFDTDTSGWTASSGTTLSLSGNELVITSDASTYGTATQSITLEANTTYVFTVYIAYSTNLYYTRYRLSGTDFYQTLLNDGVSSLGWHSVTFTTGSTVPNDIELILSARNDVVNQRIDNISIRKAELDRSVNGNGLQVFGTVTKNPVATGADLVAYSGFNNNNYLLQPVNTDLQFGTGDFCAMGWFKTTNAVTEPFYFYGQYTTGWVGGGQHRVRLTSGLLDFGMTDDNWSSSDQTLSSATYSDGNWHHYCGVRRGGQIELYADGVLVDTTVITAATGSISNTGAKLYYGRRPDGASSAITQGSLALSRFSATAPSPQQIKRIYEDEKVLFQENAQATLYGSSDAVTALAYDDSTELLHVGTSEGRSVFQGLRRVDNTTTAVGAAISASNGLVADE
jgi:hypothetical protein